MKKILIVITLFSFVFIQSQIVNIPDTNFKIALLNHNPIIDVNSDGEIQISEANNFTGNINVNNFNISDMTGIEFFTSISNLDCSRNQISSLNVENIPYLISLDCSQNELTSIDVSNNLVLQYFSCSINELTNLDISANTHLVSLGCAINQLTNLDISSNLNLRGLSCNINQITNLDLTINSNLEWADIGSNLFTEINVTNNPLLYYLDCTSSHLTSLDVSQNANLEYIYCPYNDLNNIDVSNNLLLTQLGCDYNNISLIDVTSNSLLTRLACSNNQLNYLDLSSNTFLTTLSCNNNFSLYGINLKNGNNHNFNLSSWSNFENLINLQTVCVDELDTDLTNFILSEVGSPVDFTVDCSTLNIINNKNISFLLYPIPTNDILNIKSKTEITKIEIYSKLGQLIIKNTTENKIDVSNLTQGLYFAKVEDINGNFGVKKIIIK